MRNGVRAGLPLGLLILVLGTLSPAAVRADDGDAVAMVNGRPISQRQLNRVLHESYGLRILQQLMLVDIAREKAKALGLKVTRTDIDAEYQQALEGIAGPARDPNVPLTEDEKQQALDYMLQQNCITRAEFMLGMERNAYLRRIAEQDFKVDEATLREEFARTYGEKAEVRHIQIRMGDTAALHEALNLLADGVDFAEVARRVSQNDETAARGGLMEPFAFDASDDTIAPEIRDRAFALSPGEVSTAPVRVGQWWHLLKLERRIPPADVRYDDVRDQVLAKLRDRVIRQRMNELMVKLFQAADIRVLDVDLRRDFEKFMKENTELPGTQH